MSDSLLQQLERTRNGYDVERGYHKFLLDSYTGGGGYQGAIRQPDVGWWGAASERYAPWAPSRTRDVSTIPLNYLDRFPREDESKFKGRLAVAYLWNYVEPLTQLKVSYLLSKQTSYLEQPDELAEWRDDVDGEGTSWAEMRPAIALASAIWGWMPAIIDMDPAAPGESVAQARERNVARPRLVPLTPANLVDYSHDGKRFTWAKIRTDHVEQLTWDSAPVEVSVYRIWTPTEVSVYEVRREDGKDAAVSDISTSPHPFKQVPLVIFRHLPVPGDPVHGLPMHAGPARAQKRLYNLLSELDEHIRAQVFAVAVLATKGGVPSGEVTIGTDNLLWLDAEASQKHYYMSPDPDIAGVYEARIESTIREGIYRQARVEFSRPTGAAASGVARAYEFAQTNHAIGDFAAEQARGEAWMDSIVWAGLGRDPADLDDYGVVAATDFDVEQLATDIENTLSALTVNLGPTMAKRLKMRLAERLDPNMPPDIRAKVEEELEEVDAQEQADAAMAREMRAAGDDPNADSGDGDDDEDLEDEDEEIA